MSLGNDYIGNMEHINLIDGLNINPIPLEFSQEQTTTKWLLEIQAKLNQVIDIRNEISSTSNKYVDEKYKTLETELQEKFTELNNALQELFSKLGTADILPDKSISLKKMANDFINEMQTLVIRQIDNTPKTVMFGITDEGYFYMDIPKRWDEINFSTNKDGCLVLEY